MVTMNEGIRAAAPEAEEDDELDGWGPVRVRRSSVPMPLPSHTPLAAEADNPQSDSEPQPNRNAKALMT
jgi:hypothetical protein